MKIVLIRPGIGSPQNRPAVEAYCMEPLELATLAGITPAGIDVVMFDDRIETIPNEVQADLVGITADTFTAKRAYEIASSFRKQKIPVVLGGCHPTVMPEEAIQHSDSVVIGEAEEVWARLITDLQQKKLQKFYRAGRSFSMEGILPRREVYNGKKYIYASLVEFGRGCRFNCAFCFTAILYKNTHRYRPIKEVIEDIRQTGKRSIIFSDDNIVANPEAAKKLFTAMIPLKVKWASQASINFVKDAELLRLMKESGCWGVFIGFESLCRSNLEQMNKKSNLDVASYEKALAIIRNNGIRVWGSFMIGLDYDTVEALENTLRFALSQKFFLVNFNNVSPYPGTPLYESLSQEGRFLFDKWWLDDRSRFGGPSFQPKNFSPDELCDACHKARLRFNSLWSVIKRSLDFKANIRGLPSALEFYGYNAIFLRELRRKQGMRF